MQAGTREVETGVEVVNSTGVAFNSIETIVLHVADQMKEMSTVIEHMAQGSQEIVTAVAEIDRLSKHASSESENVAAITEEQSAAAEEIAASSQALEGMAQKCRKPSASSGCKIRRYRQSNRGIRGYAEKIWINEVTLYKKESNARISSDVALFFYFFPLGFSLLPLLLCVLYFSIPRTSRVYSASPALPTMPRKDFSNLGRGMS